MQLIQLHPDLWFEGYNQRSQESGVVPYRYVIPVSNAVDESGIYQMRESFRFIYKI